MYQVLYRKWRPQTFDDVVGQEHITRTLKSAVETDRVSHAYLFTGSRGTGKTSCAKILAKAVNCEHPVNGNPCNECASCKGIDSGSIVDVVEIDAASNNGVDNIRDLREETNYMPSSVKYRVYIIDEVHMLSSGAFNALLKTLEEPPEHVKFILATTEVHKLPATILSRCQRFDFKRISPEDISSRLKTVAGNEGINLTNDGAMLIARVADGGMRDALSLLDRCASFGETVDEALVARASGIAGKEHLFRLTDAVFSKDTESALGIVGELYQNSCDMERLMSSLISHLRNLMICLSVKNPKELILSSETDIEKYTLQAQRTTLEEILSCMDTVNAAISDMKRGTDKRVTAEMTVIKLTSPALSSDIGSVLRRISALEQGVKAGGFKQKENAVSAPVVKHEEPKPEVKPVAVKEPEKEEEVIRQTPPERQKKEEIIPPPPTEEKVLKSETEEMKPLTSWPEIKKIISESNQMMASFLTRSKAFVSGNVLIIKDANPIITNFIKSQENYGSIENAVLGVTGEKYKITVFGEQITNEAKAESETDAAESGLDRILKKAQGLNIQIIEQ